MATINQVDSEFCGAVGVKKGQRGLLICRTVNDDCNSGRSEEPALEGQMLRLRLNMATTQIICDRAMRRGGGRQMRGVL